MEVYSEVHTREKSVQQPGIVLAKTLANSLVLLFPSTNVIVLYVSLFDYNDPPPSPPHPS